MEDGYWVLEGIGEEMLCNGVLNDSGPHPVALDDGVGEVGVVLCDRVCCGHV